MKQLSVEDLRALIRLIPAARALRDELEKSIHLETYAGTGELAVRSFRGLRESVYVLTEDPYVQALDVTVGEGVRDKHLVSQVMLAAAQLLAYMEGQAGVAGLSARQSYSVQTAPHVTLNMDGFDGDPMMMERIMETVDRTMKFKVPPVPPVPPTPPIPQTPPMPPHFGWHDADFEIEFDEADLDDLDDD